MINRLLEVFTKREVYAGLTLLLAAIVTTLYFSPFAIVYGIATVFIYANNL